MLDITHKLIETARLRADPAKSISPVRIAISALCLLACFLFIVLWLRSFTWRDKVGFQLYGTRMVRFTSTHGKLEFETHALLEDQDSYVSVLRHSDISEAWRRDVGIPEPQDPKKWRWEVTRTGRLYVYVPHLFLVLLTAALAATPWVRWRFSLRTFLIAMVLIAVLIGLLVISN